jgi:hypothetical protein
VDEIKPKDLQSMPKVAHGRLIGAVEDLAVQGSCTPGLERNSAVDSVVRKGSTFHMKQKDRMTIRIIRTSASVSSDWRCTDASRTGDPRSS